MKQKGIDKATKVLLNAGKLPKHKRIEPTKKEFGKEVCNASR